MNMPKHRTRFCPVFVQFFLHAFFTKFFPLDLYVVLALHAAAEHPISFVKFTPKARAFLRAKT